VPNPVIELLGPAIQERSLVWDLEAQSTGGTRYAGASLGLGLMNCLCADSECEPDPTAWNPPSSAPVLLEGFDDDPFNEPEGRARGVNTNGFFVGFQVDGIPEALVWKSKDETPIVLNDTPDPNGQFPIDEVSRAEAINNLEFAQIVGSDRLDFDALLWDPVVQNGDIVDWEAARLNDEINSGYTDLNDEGWIIATGRDSDADDHAYALIPLGDCPSDINEDGVVDVSDLLALLAAWGACPEQSICPEDIDASPLRAVSVEDLLILLGAWGDCEGQPEPIPQTVQDCLDRFDYGSLELEKCIEAIESQ
jgi:hypothetical protein